NDALEFLPERTPVLTLEIEGIDVLILLGRVFGIPNGAVLAMAEPLRMLTNVGVVGRALKGEVERDLDPPDLSFPLQGVKISKSAQGRVYCLGAAKRRPDCPGAAWVSGLEVGGIVFAFTVCRADRVDRRQIEDIEAHPGDVRQASDDVGKVPRPHE